MRRVATVVMALVLALILVGCTDTAVEAPDRPAASTRRAIPAGSAVTLDNGLTLTVPTGWTAKLTSYPSPDGFLSESEGLVLENFDVGDGPSTLMVFSSTAASLPLSAINKYGRDEFRSFGQVDGVDLFVGQPGTPYEPKRLMSAQTRVPGSALGVLYFAGDPSDPEAALRGIVKLFRIGGI